MDIHISRSPACPHAARIDGWFVMGRSISVAWYPLNERAWAERMATILSMKGPVQYRVEPDYRRDANVNVA